MLPKIWEKLLLAICIIAILFNITSKLVNRISLEKTISSAPEGIDVKEILNIVDDENTVTKNNLESKYNTVTENKVVEEENVENSSETEEPVEPQEDVPEEENKEASNKG